MQLSKDYCVNYVFLTSPVTFKDVLILWIGEERYNEILAYDPHSIINQVIGQGFDDHLKFIRQVEAVLDDAIRGRRIHVYRKSPGGAGRAVFYEHTYDQGALFSNTREGYGKDGLHKCFQFMLHHPDNPYVESKPLYFDQDEIFAQFPDLMPSKTENSSSEKLSPSADEKHSLSTEERNAAAEKWKKYRSTLSISTNKRERRKLQAAHIAELKFSGKSHREIFDIVFPTEQNKCPGTKRKRISDYKALANKIAQDINLPAPPW
ncbi:MAG: hypothetical protein FWG59_01440 [Betaproteobacteria bacterium]|nr:hypothetical protein [Betaproteobacteria bacterium]